MIYTLISWLPATLWAAALFLLSAQREVPGASWLPINDKVAHLLAYTVLGATLAWGGRRTRAHAGQRTPARTSTPLARALASPPVLVMLGALFAASDEWHQSFVPGRDPSVWDFTADVLGIVVGMWVVRALTRPGSEAGKPADAS
jgi:VanZ family protein